MKIFWLIIALFLLWIGINYLYSPKSVLRLHKWLQKHILNDENVSKRRYQTGTLLAILSLLILCMLFFWR